MADTVDSAEDLLARAETCRRVAASFADRADVARLWLRWAEEYEARAAQLMGGGAEQGADKSKPTNRPVLH